MQTVYYQTSNFIRHTDNVVDLNEYRRKMALAQEGSLAPKPQVQDFEEEWEQPVLREITPRRSRQREKRAMVLDLCASLSVVIMTLTFTIQLLVL